MNRKIHKFNYKYLLIIFIVIVFSFFLFYYFFNYKVNSRVNNLKNYKSSDSYVHAVGWLKIQGTNIDYPVIYNSSSIDINAIGEENYLWTNVNNKKISNRVFIVGHNIKNVSKNPLITNKDHVRFEQLLSFVYYDFAKDNEYVQYTIDGTDYLYKIFSISFIDNDKLDYGMNSYKKEKLDKYINNSIKSSLFKYNVKVNKNDSVITLVTCTRMFGAYANKAFKIDARMVRKGEFTNKYKVTKNKNYNNILDIMEGDNENEKA